MKMITKRNATLCLLWLAFGLSLPIYAFWAVFNYDHLCLWTEKFCVLIDKIFIQKRYGKKEVQVNKRCH